MTSKVREQEQTAQQAPASRFGDKVVRVIEDPFGSVIAGIVAPAAAVAMVVSGIYGLAVVY